jgi:ADP-heptose:LPS heptosyltransferase
VQRILIIRFSSIGDIVLTTPVVRCLREQFPEADIRFITKKEYALLVDSNPYLNGVLLLENGLKELIKRVKEFKPDVVVDLHYNLRTRMLKTAVGGKWYQFNKLNVEKWMRVNLKVDRLPNEHIVDRYLQSVAELDVKNDGAGLDFFFPEDFQAPEFPSELGSEFVALVIGAKFKTKQLPASKLIEICNGLTQPVVLIGGPEDDGLAQDVIAESKGKVFNGCGKYSLLESAWFIKQSALVITHDTGMMHIAAAFNKKIISVWGNTIPAFGMYPYLPESGSSFISEVENLHCRPCSKIGFDKCPKGHFDCMEKQNVSSIIERANKTLK